MAFPKEYIDFEVVELNNFSNYNGVSVYKGRHESMCLQGFSDSASAINARWLGDAVIVTMKDGEVRYYTDFDSFEKIDTYTKIENGKSYQVPQIHDLKVGGKEYVYIVKNEKACIFKKTERLIGEYELFAGCCEDSKYALVKLNGKYNYYSFEKNCHWFDRWFDDGELDEEIDGKCLFRVVENGVFKILDEQGNDVSNSHAEYLQEWIRQYEKDKSLCNNDNQV